MTARILVVDDTPTNVKLLEARLTAEYFEVLTASNGPQALALCAESLCDIVLLDEPYQGFDRGSYLDFWQHVWEWRDAGKAVVVVTHLLSQLDRVDTVLDLTPARRAVA